jgi:hypothetical protein
MARRARRQLLALGFPTVAAFNIAVVQVLVELATQHLF